MTAARPKRSPVSWTQALLALLIFLPGLAALAFIARFSVNCLFRDEWDLVPYLEDFYAHRLTVARLFEQHNEHRIFFPRMIFLYLGTLTGYDTRVFMYLSWATLVVGMLCLALMHVRLFGKSTRALAGLVPVAMLQFHLRQSENLLWGWQLQIVLCVELFIVSVVLLCRENASQGAFLGALACLAVGTFSFSSGLLAWPSLLMLLAYQRALADTDAAKRVLNLRLLFVAGAMLAVVAIYLHGYVTPKHHPSVAFVLHEPMAGLREFAGALGSPASDDVRVCVVAGCLYLAFALLLLVIAAKGGVDRRRFAPAIPLFAFSIGVAAMISVGRAGYGLFTANASRYVTLCLPGLIGIFYGALATTGGMARKVTLVLVFAALGITLVLGDIGVLSTGRHEESSRELGVDAILHPNLHTAREAHVLYPRTDLIIPYSRFLSEHRLSVFAE